MKVQAPAALLRPGHFLCGSLPALAKYSVAPDAKLKVKDVALTTVEYRHVVSITLENRITLVIPDDELLTIYPTESNENCLAGMACPKCLNFKHLLIKSESALGEVTDDGSESVLDWSSNSPCICPECLHVGTVALFSGKTPTEFNPFQQAVLAAGVGPSVTRPVDMNSCGDGLLSFVLDELSTEESCDSLETADRRLTTAIEDLTTMRNALWTNPAA